jgi:hypothetical protein
MGTSLSGLTPADTYQSLIKVGDNSALSATLKTLSDGAGNDLPIQVSTTAINFTGNVGVYNKDIISSNATPNRTTKLNASGLYLSRLSDGTYPNSITADGSMYYDARGNHIFRSDTTPLFEISNAYQNVTIGSASPISGGRLVVKGSGSTSATTSLLVQNSSGGNLLQVKDNGLLTSNVDNEGGAFSIDVDTNAQTTLKLKPFGNNFNAAYQATIYNNYGSLVIKSAAYGNVTTELFGNGQYKITDNFAYNYLTVYGANVGGKSVFGRPVEIKGTGSTSATTSLLVQNSAGSTALQILDDKVSSFGGNLYLNGGIMYTQNPTSYPNNYLYQASNITILSGVAIRLASGPVGISEVAGGANATASSILDCQSTTKGFLTPRMTNAQRLAIASPAIGLEVYCTDAVEGKYIYKSTGWTFVV